MNGCEEMTLEMLSNEAFRIYGENSFSKMAIELTAEELMDMYDLDEVEAAELAVAAYEEWLGAF